MLAAIGAQSAGCDRQVLSRINVKFGRDFKIKPLSNFGRVDKKRINVKFFEFRIANLFAYPH